MIKFFLDTHGCAKNQVDSELIISQLSNIGYKQTFDAAEAQVIIVNSCGFINSAKQESLNAFFSAKKQYPDAKIVLTGCLAERYAEDFRKDLPEADGLFGNGDLSKISEFMKAVMDNKRPVIVPSQQGISCGKRYFLYNFRRSAYVKITEGCNNWCSFCAIPIIRGELRSRIADDIVHEITELISNGIYEINLIGQDLAAYGTGRSDNVFGGGPLELPSLVSNPLTESFDTQKKSGIVLLIEKISQIKGDFKIRLLYIHPDHFDINIIKAIQDDNRILPYFDIPFQSGSDIIIKAMNRKGDSEQYKNLIIRIRKELPDSSIRTTFLVGFPGERAEEFKDTVSFLQEICPDWSGNFAYSPEEGTKGILLKNRASKKLAEKRAEELVNIQTAITRKNLKKRIEKQYDVLVEEVISGEEGLAIGRAWFQAPEVDGSVVIRYDKENEKEKNIVQPGAVVRVRAVASSDVDIDTVLISAASCNIDLPVDSYTHFPDICADANEK